MTILSLAVAIYTLRPLERVLDLKFKFAWYDGIVVFSAIVLVLYILYQPVLQELDWAFDFGPWRWEFDASLATIIVVALVWVVVRLRFGGLRRKRIHVFSRLATDLLHKRKTGELVEMLKRYLPQLMKIYENDYSLVRLRNWLAPSIWEVLGHRRNQTEQWPKAVRSSSRLLSRLLPTYEESRDSAKETVHRILLSDNFVETVATAYPYFAMSVLKYDVHELVGFQDKWFQFVLDDPNSVVYAEIQRNQVMQTDSYHQYQYDPENRCLFFYFADVRNAERLKLYKSIGDYLCVEYGKRRRNPEADRFNQPLDRYCDIEVRNCPAYSVIRLFDYMISQSLYQGIPWHMWLHYLPIFADKILANLSPHDDVNLDSEFPTPYHFQLYEIINVLCKWIASAQDVPEYESEEDRERAIPMQSVIALGRVMNAILLSPVLEAKFLSYMVVAVIGHADNWRTEPKLKLYREKLISNLAIGGRDWGVPDTWPGILKRCVATADVARYHQIQKEINEALDAKWGGF